MYIPISSPLVSPLLFSSHSLIEGLFLSKSGGKYVGFQLFEVLMRNSLIALNPTTSGSKKSSNEVISVPLNMIPQLFTKVS